MEQVRAFSHCVWPAWRGHHSPCYAPHQPGPASTQLKDRVEPSLCKAEQLRHQQDSANNDLAKALQKTDDMQRRKDALEKKIREVEEELVNLRLRDEEATAQAAALE